MSNPFDSTEWHGLVRTMCEHRRDDVARLVAADWLDEAGQGDFAKFIRQQVAMASMPIRTCIVAHSHTHNLPATHSDHADAPHFFETTGWCSEFHDHVLTPTADIMVTRDHIKTSVIMYNVPIVQITAETPTAQREFTCRWSGNVTKYRQLAADPVTTEYRQLLRETQQFRFPRELLDKWLSGDRVWPMRYRRGFPSRVQCDQDFWFEYGHKLPWPVTEVDIFTRFLHRYEVDELASRLNREHPDISFRMCYRNWWPNRVADALAGPRAHIGPVVGGVVYVGPPRVLGNWV